MCEYFLLCKVIIEQKGAESFHVSGFLFGNLQSRSVIYHFPSWLANRGAPVGVSIRLVICRIASLDLHNRHRFLEVRGE